MKKSLVVRLVEVAASRPWPTLLICLALAAISLFWATTHFTMTTDTAELISPKVKWRVDEARLAKAFPQQNDLIVAVVDGRTPELAEDGAARLSAKLLTDKTTYAGVRRPDGGEFFAREGLLLQSTAEVKATTENLVKAQPFLGPLAADPSLRGVMTTLQAFAQGVAQGQTTLAEVDKPIAGLADAMQDAAKGRQVFFSWQSLVGGGGLSAPRRRFILVQPKLDYGDLTPGAKAGDAIHAAARSLALDAAHGVTVRLTGSVPLSDEEFASLADRVWLVTGAMLAAVLLMLWLAVRSVRMMGAILFTTILGLLMTAAVGLVTVGRFNLISVAFIPLFVGLGIDFGIQVSVRFRAERLETDDPVLALSRAAAGIGGSLALAAAAVTLGFFAFLPTSYVGVSELGVIAGFGMVIGLVLNITLLPALLILLKAKSRGGEAGTPSMAPLDRFMHERRKLVLQIAAGSAVISILLLPSSASTSIRSTCAIRTARRCRPSPT